MKQRIPTIHGDVKRRPVRRARVRTQSERRYGAAAGTARPAGASGVRIINHPPPPDQPREAGRSRPLPPTGPARPSGEVLEPAILLELVVDGLCHLGQCVLRADLPIHRVAGRGCQLVPEQVPLRYDRPIMAVGEQISEYLLVATAEGRVLQRLHPGRVVAGGLAPLGHLLGVGDEGNELEAVLDVLGPLWDRPRPAARPGCRLDLRWVREG